MCLLIPSNKEIKPNDFKAIIGQSAFKVNIKGVGRAGKRQEAFSSDLKKSASVQTGIVDVAWVKTIGYYCFNPYKTGCLITTEDQKSRRNPGQMAPKSSPDLTTPPWVSVCPYSVTKQMRNLEIQKEAGNLVLLGKTESLGTEGRGPVREAGTGPHPSLAGRPGRCRLQLVYELL